MFATFLPYLLSPQVQFVHNSCEAHLAPSAAGCVPEEVLREMRKLRVDACASMQRFAQFKVCIRSLASQRM
jgi:hypothetical protein